MNILNLLLWSCLPLDDRLFPVQVKREAGDVSILVNNAGIVTGKKFMDAPDSLIEKTLEVNTMAHFWVSNSRTNSFLSGCVLNSALESVFCIFHALFKLCAIFLCGCSFKLGLFFSFFFMSPVLLGSDLQGFPSCDDCQ